MPQGRSLAWYCGLGLGFGGSGGWVLSGDPARAFTLWKAAGASARSATTASLTVIMEAQTEEVSSTSPPTAER